MKATLTVVAGGGTELELRPDTVEEGRMLALCHGMNCRVETMFEGHMSYANAEKVLLVLSHSPDVPERVTP